MKEDERDSLHRQGIFRTSEGTDSSPTPHSSWAERQEKIVMMLRECPGGLTQQEISAGFGHEVPQQVIKTDLDILAKVGLLRVLKKPEEIHFVAVRRRS